MITTISPSAPIASGPTWLPTFMRFETVRKNGLRAENAAHAARTANSATTPRRNRTLPPSLPGLDGKGNLPERPRQSFDHVAPPGAHPAPTGLEQDRADGQRADKQQLHVRREVEEAQAILHRGDDQHAEQDLEWAPRPPGERDPADRAGGDGLERKERKQVGLTGVDPRGEHEAGHPHKGAGGQVGGPDGAPRADTGRTGGEGARPEEIPRTPQERPPEQNIEGQES